MDSTQLAMITERSEQLREKWRELFEIILSIESSDGQKFDTTLPIPNLGISVDDLNIHIETIFSEARSFSKAPVKSFLLAPPLASRRLQDSLEKTSSAIEEFLESLKKSLKSLNAETFQGTVAHPSQSNRQLSVNFVEKFSAIARYLDEAFVRSAQLKVVTGSSSRESNFDTLIDSIRNAEKHARQYFSDLQEKETAIQSMLNNASSSSQEIESIERKLTKMYQSCVEINQTFEETSEELSGTVDTISNTSKTASELKQQVIAYQGEFEQFQVSIDTHKESLLQGQREQERLLNEISEIENQITEKNNQASNMLANATVAGLAASFGATRDNLNKELTWARRVFYGSIFVLFMLSVPMILYVIPGLTIGGSMYENGSSGFGEIVSQLFARATILLPGILFVAFASRRHSSLFRLREHYVYKYNMAASVEGFKQQAPEISGAIAGTTFYELLTHNPADTMDGGRKSPHNNSRQAEGNPLAEAVKRFLSKNEEPNK